MLTELSAAPTRLLAFAHAGMLPATIVRLPAIVGRLADNRMTLAAPTANASERDLRMHTPYALCVCGRRLGRRSCGPSSTTFCTVVDVFIRRRRPDRADL